MAYVIALFIPPLAVLMLPDRCVGNKMEAFAIALILWLLTWIGGIAYVYPMISACEHSQAIQVPAQTVAPQQGAQRNVVVVPVVVQG